MMVKKNKFPIFCRANTYLRHQICQPIGVLCSKVSPFTCCWVATPAYLSHIGTAAGVPLVERFAFWSRLLHIKCVKCVATFQFIIRWLDHIVWERWSQKDVSLLSCYATIVMCWGFFFPLRRRVSSNSYQRVEAKASRRCIRPHEYLVKMFPLLLVSSLSRQHCDLIDMFDAFLKISQGCYPWWRDGGREGEWARVRSALNLCLSMSQHRACLASRRLWELFFHCLCLLVSDKWRDSGKVN